MDTPSEKDLQRVVYQPTARKGGCGLCLQDITSKESYTQFDCKHMFHENCLNKQGPEEDRSKCPYCKRQVLRSANGTCQTEVHVTSSRS
jgi:hypothetical protein